MNNGEPMDNDDVIHKKTFYNNIKHGLDKLFCNDRDKLKQKIILSVIEGEAQKNLSQYRQRKEDLIARMATDWPEWGCGLEFYSFFILPLLRNPLLMHFINKSDGISLQDYMIEYGYVESGRIKYAGAQIEIGQKKYFKPDLVDWAIYSLCYSMDPILQNNSDVFILRDVGQQHIETKPYFVRIRAADIGVQAFFSLFEGVIRNAAKHRIRREGGDRNEFKIKIIFFQDYEELCRICGDCDLSGIGIEDDTCYIMISISEDVMKYDNKERKINELNIIDFLNSALSEKVIGDKGEIAPGNWGMKEIKICACFEAGRDLDMANTTSPDYIKVIKCPDGIWEEDKEDNVERFSYLLTFEKPKYILVLSSNNNIFKGIEARSWGKNGVKIVTYDELKNNIYDYEILFVEEALSVDSTVRSWIHENRFNLPSRMVFEGGNNQYDDSLNSVSVDNDNDKIISTFISSEYIKVLEAYMKEDFNKRCEYLITIYFEDNDLAKKWRKWWKGSKSKYQGVKLNCEFPKEPKIKDNRERKRKISIMRHRGVSMVRDLTRLNSNGYPNNNYYYEHASYSDQFFSLLMNIDPESSNWLASLILCQLLEATLLNILVIDERIAQILANEKAPDEPDMDLIEKLYWMGIYITDGFSRVLDNNKTQFLFDYIPNMRENLNRRFITIDFDQFTGNKTGIFSIEGIPIDILLIHATRLNEIYMKYCEDNSNELTREKFIEEVLKKKFRHIIVHSGRGKTKGDIPRNVPFMEYSLVQKYLVGEPSKFFLTQVALNAKAGY